MTGKIGKLVASLALMFSLGATASVLQAMPASAARGNITQEQNFWWGARIWLDHNATQSAWRSVQATGNLSNLSIPGVPWWVTAPLKYISCVGQFVNDVRRDDVGYGVVMDVNWWAPFWSCGTLKVWSQ